MTLHKRHTHGRVFVGEEAREMLAIHRRDSHGNNIVMNVPDGFDSNATPTDVTTTIQPMTTQVSVIYVTLPQTFSGSAVYSTMTGSDNAAATGANVAMFGAQAGSTASSTAAFPTSTSAAGKTGGQNNINNNNAQTATAVVGSPIQATSNPTAAASSDGTAQDAGMSGGAKAGMAFGILFAIALVCGLLFFCWRRKKNPNGHEEIVDEKHTSFVDAKAKSMETRNRTSVESEKAPASVRSSRTATTAPRLSLRPVTQFLPNLGGNEANHRNTTDSFLAVGAAANAGSGAKGSAWERKPASGNNANPFDDGSAAAAKSRSPSPQANPFDENEEKSAGAAASAAASSSTKHSPKSSVGSADGSQSGAAKAAPVVAGAAAAAQAANGAPRSAQAGPGPAPGPNNVHRVQLDFKPSMEDELELRSGQLVRMLHEYDDGWVSSAFTVTQHK
jgi:hypothetical protein